MKKHFKAVFACTFVLVILLTIVSTAAADPCDIPPGQYRTATPGGWGANCHGGNDGCIRDNNFANTFPNGLVVGGTYTITFTTPAAVNTFLPNGGTPGVLTGNLVNPSSSPAGEFASQVIALALSLGFSNAHVTGFNSALGTLVIPSGVHNPTGAFAGWTVNHIFQVANQVLGGDLTALPHNITLGDLNSALNSINSNFDDGHVSGGYLVESGCDQILPVEMSSFDATPSTNGILVEWRTASENGVASYELSRRAGNDWQSIASVPSQGSSPTGFAYNYSDLSVARGVNYEYRLTIHNVDGSRIVHSTLASARMGSVESPTEWTLSQNYPNPFNPTTSISFTLQEKSFTTLKVYNMIGDEVATLVNGSLAQGTHTVSFDATNLPSGLYFYRLDAYGFVAEKKMLLVK